MTLSEGTMTLIELQDWAVDRLLETRSSERRYAKFRSAVYRGYAAGAKRMGYDARAIAEQWRDVKDMVILEREADENE